MGRAGLAPVRRSRSSTATPCARALRELGIATGVHYPTPIHLQPAYAHLGHGPGAFPEAERSAARVLSLPMYPELTDAQVDRVVDGLLDATERSW